MAQLVILPTEGLSSSRLEELRRLLFRSFDGRFSDQDWEHTLGGRHVLALESGRVSAPVGVV